MRFAIGLAWVVVQSNVRGDAMSELMMWSVWYGIVATLPLGMTRLVISHALVRNESRRRAYFSRQLKKEVSRVVL